MLVAGAKHSCLVFFRSLRYKGSDRNVEKKFCR